jgi:hypothetical protein
MLYCLCGIVFVLMAIDVYLYWCVSRIADVLRMIVVEEEDD